MARFKAGDYHAAAADFEAALELDAGSAMDLANMGLCQLRLGRKDIAVHYLENALKLDPEIRFAQEQLDAILHGDQGE